MVLLMTRVSTGHLSSRGTQHSAGLKPMFNVNCLGVKTREPSQGECPLVRFVIISAIFALSFIRRELSSQTHRTFSSISDCSEEERALGKPS